MIVFLFIFDSTHESTSVHDFNAGTTTSSTNVLLSTVGNGFMSFTMNQLVIECFLLFRSCGDRLEAQWIWTWFGFITSAFLVFLFFSILINNLYLMLFENLRMNALLKQEQNSKKRWYSCRYSLNKAYQVASQIACGSVSALSFRAEQTLPKPFFFNNFTNYFEISLED